MLARIKFEVAPLVNEMLDQLPAEIWSSKTTTFLDPAIAGGQFVKEIESRLLQFGHSKKNITNRVFGCEQYPHQVQYAISKHKLVGKYFVANFLEQDFQNMKFDVIVGNPPFKNKNEKGGASALWRKIVSKSWGILKDDGTIAMVAPQLPNSSKDLGDIFTKNQTATVWTKISHHFPGVGSSFYAWIVHKTPKTKKTFFIDENLTIDLTKKDLPNDLHSIALFDKIMSHKKFVCKSSPEYMHTSVADGKDEDHLSRYKSSKLKYVLRRTSGANYEMYGAVQPTDYTLPKVVFTFSGNPHYKFHNANNPIGTIKYQSGHILVKNQTEAKNLIKLYQSNVYIYLQKQMTSGGMRGKVFYELPALDLSKTWTDIDIYTHFNLTKQEIIYIETSIA